MAAHNDASDSLKDVDTLITRIPKFSGALNPGESGEVRRAQFIRWKYGVVKVLNLKGYGELIPAEDLAEVGAEDTIESGGGDLEGGDEDRSSVRSRARDMERPRESDATRRSRLAKLERPALAIISLSLQTPVSDWVDILIGGKQSFRQVWDALKNLYGVHGDIDELSVMETFATMKMSEYEDPLKFYMKIISFSRQFEACGNTSLSTVARRVVAFMTKIPKAKGEAWETFAATAEQKQSDVGFMQALKAHFDTKVQPTYSMARKNTDGAAMMAHVGADSGIDSDNDDQGKAEGTGDHCDGDDHPGRTTRGSSMDPKCKANSGARGTGGVTKVERPCLVCGSKDHLMVECRWFIQAKQRAQCAACGKSGHLLDDCPLIKDARKLASDNGGSKDGGAGGVSAMMFGI
jgi:hypothetical protein